MISYFIWNADPALFSIGSFTLRWNALLILLAYIAGRKLLFYIHKTDGKPALDAGALTAYVLIIPLLFARLFYVLLHRRQLLWNEPVEILFPFDFVPTFHLTDSAGLSIYGVTPGVLIAVWLYNRKRWIDQPFLRSLDWMSVGSCLVAFFLFSGSFLNSGIAGKPTDSSIGTVFIHPVVKGLEKIPCCIMRNPDGKNPLQQVVIKKDKTAQQADTLHRRIILYLFFKPGTTEQLVNEFLIGDVKTYLFDMSAYVYEPGTEPLHYSIIVAKDRQYIGRIQTRGISRYPVDAIEAISSLILFVCLLLLWNKKRTTAPPGLLFGYFMILFWGIHLCIGYMRAGQGIPEITLCILFILTGALAIGFSARKTAINS